MKKILVFLLVCLTVYLVYFFVQKNQSPPSNTPSKETLNIEVPDGWQKFEDDKLMISFYTPPEFIIEQNGQHSVMAKHPTSQSKVGDVEFFYVSVVPDRLFENETGEAYNYQKSFHNKLIGIEIGEIKNLSAVEGQKDWYMYERNSDISVNGKTAKVFVNQRPWEFPAGIWEYRYVFEFPKKIVIAGGYIVGGPSDTPLSLPIFEKIVSTLVIRE